MNATVVHCPDCGRGSYAPDGVAASVAWAAHFAAEHTAEHTAEREP